MHYVVASDGQKYGPADLTTLNTWIGYGRLTLASVLEDAATGARLPAANLPGLLFTPTPDAPHPNAASYPRPAYDTRIPKRTDSNRIWGSIALAAASIPVAYFIGFLSIVLAGYGVRMAFAAKNEDDSPLGLFAVVVTIALTVVMVVVRLFFRHRWR